MNTQRGRFQAFVLLVLAYEWLISGLDKVLSGHFVTGLQSTLKESLSTIPYGFYRIILHALIIPHAAAFGWIVMLGELLLGLSFSALAIFYLRGAIPGSIRVGGGIAAFFASFLNMNFFFFQAGHFFITPSDPFDEGIPVDFLMAAMELGLMISLLGESIRSFPLRNRAGGLSRSLAKRTSCVSETNRNTRVT